MCRFAAAIFYCGGMIWANTFERRKSIEAALKWKIMASRLSISILKLMRPLFLISRSKQYRKKRSKFLEKEFAIGLMF